MQVPVTFRLLVLSKFTTNSCHLFIYILLVTVGRFWQILAEQRKKKPQAITLADKNAPNEEVWKQVRFCLHAALSYKKSIICSPFFNVYRV